MSLYPFLFLHSSFFLVPPPFLFRSSKWGLLNYKPPLFILFLQNCEWLPLNEIERSAEERSIEKWMKCLEFERVHKISCHCIIENNIVVSTLCESVYIFLRKECFFSSLITLQNYFLCQEGLGWRVKGWKCLWICSLRCEAMLNAPLSAACSALSSTPLKEEGKTTCMSFDAAPPLPFLCSACSIAAKWNGRRNKHTCIRRRFGRRWGITKGPDVFLKKLCLCSFNKV